MCLVGKANFTSELESLGVPYVALTQIIHVSYVLLYNQHT